MGILKYFSVFFIPYTIISLFSFIYNNEMLTVISLIFALISSFFLRKELKKMERQEFKIPYAGAYLMLLGYLGILVGVPVSLISLVHLLGLTLVLVGALFVDIGLATALVIGSYRMTKTFHNNKYNVIAILFLLGLIFSLIFKGLGDLFYLLSSIFILVESL